MREQTYAGHTLAAIKAVAEAAADRKRKRENEIQHAVATGEMDVFQCFTQMRQLIDTTIPATVLAMAARIEELARERDKLREDYDAQGLALKASKAMQLAETQRADALDQEHAAALRLVAEVRHACGDDGKRMLPELVQYVGELAKDAARLNWVIEESCAVFCTHDGRHYVEWRFESGDEWQREQYKSGRDAIDAVMEQAKNREGA